MYAVLFCRLDVYLRILSKIQTYRNDFVQYLTTADFGIREELALKAAILAEKFAPDLSWYK